MGVLFEKFQMKTKIENKCTRQFVKRGTSKYNYFLLFTLSNSGYNVHYDV